MKLLQQLMAATASTMFMPAMVSMVVFAAAPTMTVFMLMLVLVSGWAALVWFCQRNQVFIQIFKQSPGTGSEYLEVTCQQFTQHAHSQVTHQNPVRIFLGQLFKQQALGPAMTAFCGQYRVGHALDLFTFLIQEYKLFSLGEVAGNLVLINRNDSDHYLWSLHPCGSSSMPYRKQYIP